MVERVEAGRTYRVAVPLVTHCVCGVTLPVGTFVWLFKQTSKNRVLMECSKSETGARAIHWMRLSTTRMAVEELEA